MKKLTLLLIAPLLISHAKSQVRTPTLYVTGTVNAEEKMLVSVKGTKTIEGNVVSAEVNGKKTEARTDKDGHAYLDFSRIAGDVVNPTIAIIKTLDKDGNLISTANTSVHKGKITTDKPLIEKLPYNLPKGEALTIPGEHLGADAKLVCADKEQETLAASDREMTALPNPKPGEQPVYVKTPNGVSETQHVNFYSLEFELSKNSITPGENVQAKVNYESIPVGTKLIFTNNSREVITMMIPGAQNAGAVSTYTVPEKNGSFPVNITGIIRGNFVIALDFGFNEAPPASELKKSLTKLNEFDQKKIYSAMPAETKCALWKEHLGEALKMPMQQNQKALIQELETRLNPDIFYTNSAPSNEFKTYALGWYSRAREAFPGSELVKLDNMVRHLGGPIANGGIPDCDCVRNGAILNCPLYHECRTRSCRDNWCGVFWLWTCNALCV